MGKVSASDVLAKLAALAGEDEAVLGSNNTTVNKYFNAAGQAYCGYSLWYAAKKAGSDIFANCSNPAYVPTVNSWGQKYCTVVTDHSKAQAGDIFAYKDQHVGFVYAAYSGTTVITLEGNSKVYTTLAEAKSSRASSGSFEGIGYKKRNLSSDYYVYRPSYGGSSASTSGTSGTSSTATASSVNYSDKIKVFQKWLKENFKLDIVADGEYGKLTKKAACKAWQMAMNDNYDCGLEVDGTFGKLCKEAANEHEIKSGVKNDVVHVLQGMLYCNGYDVHGMDGDFGPSTRTALISYQRDNGLSADGGAGPETFGKMFK